MRTTVDIRKTEIKKKLEKEFDKKQSTVLADVIADTYEDLVKVSDFNELKGIVKELAEAQKRTEMRVEELAEAQKRTEESLNRLIVRVDFHGERLEGLSDTIGYTIENKAYKALPLLLKDEGIGVKEKLIRRYYKIGEKNYQLNIYGKGIHNGEEILILGEAKVRPSKGEIQRFLKIVDRVRKEEGDCAVYLIFVAHDFPPDIEIYLKEKGIRYFWSYELE